MGNLSFETNILQFQQVIDRKPGERHNQSVEFEDDINALFETYQSLLPMAEEDEARLWTKFRLDWNYNSNRIEGNTLTRGETKALLEEGIKPIRMRKDILQMQSHDKAIDFLKELVESDAPLTEVDIRDLHKTALGENYWTEAITAENVITKREIEIGVYKKVPNVVLKSDGTTHEYAAPNEVPLRMAATLKTIRQYLKMPDFELHDFMAELHQDFIQTHPFDDGNGRMVRLLINYVCLKLGWPPVIIKSEKRADYIAALENWNDGNEAPFRKLMKEELTWSLKKSIQAARGEDIDDPEDLDKEIDLFVRETASKIAIERITPINKLNVFKSVYLASLKRLNQQIKTFAPLFAEISTPPLLGDFNDEVYIDLMHYKKTVEQKIKFERLNSIPQKPSFEIILTIQFWENCYEVSSLIRQLPDANIPSRAMLDVLTSRKIEPKSLLDSRYYDLVVNKKTIEKFVDEVRGNFLTILKSMAL